MINNSRHTEAATSGSGITLTTPSPVTVKATSSNTADAQAPGGGGGAVQIAVIVAVATLSAHTTTNAQGGFTGANGITISAIADNAATAHVTIFGISVIGISGGVAVATIDSGTNIETTVGSGATLSGGAIVVEAKTRNSGNVATATGEGGTIGFLFAGTAFVAVATNNGSVRTHMNGKVTGGSSLTVNADGTIDAEAHTFAGSIGIGALAVAVSIAQTRAAR